MNHRSLLCAALAVACLFLRVCPAAQAQPDDLVATAKRLAAQGTEHTVRGNEGWLFFRGELRHLAVGVFWGEAAAKVSLARRPDLADPLEAIVDYHRQCEARGIELIMLPVPPKAVIYPDKLAALALTRADANHQAFYAALRDEGVTVLDMTDQFIANRDADTPMYCKQDTHWAHPAMALAAQAVATNLRVRAWYKPIVKTTYRTKNISIELRGDLVRTDSVPTLEAETIALRRILDAHDQTVRPSAASPVVLMGDSHCLVFHAGGDMHATGAGFADQLAMALGFPVDVVAVRGSGARPARVALFRRAKEEGWLDDKKAIIWCFAAREFTQADGWGKVPLKR